MFDVWSMVRGCPSARPNIREDLTPFRNLKRITLLLALDYEHQDHLWGVNTWVATT